MTSFRLALVLSLLLHGAAIGTAWGFGAGAPAARPELRVEVRPSEDAGAPPRDAAAPVEVVEVEKADAPPLQPPTEPEPPPAATEDDLALPEWTRFTAVLGTDAVPHWLTAVVPRAASSDPAEPVTPPPAPSALVLEVIAGQNAPPEYPWLARRRGWQGVAAILVRVDAAGMVSTAAVARSSGHQVLDAAALKAVRAWRFRGGPGETTLEFEFRLRAK